MKYLLFVLGLTIAGTTITSHALHAQSTDAAFYRKHKRKPGVRNFKLPGWLIWFGGGLAYNSINDPDARSLLKLGKKVRNMRVMFVEDGNPISDGEINAFVGNIRQNNYEDLIYVRSEGTEVNVMVRNKNKKLKNLIFLVNDDGEFVYFGMKTAIKIKHINQVIKDLLHTMDFLDDKKVEKRKRKKKEKKAKPDIPIA